MSEPTPGRDLNECDREPIHIPGSIQPHGALLVLEAENLTVVQCSENVTELMAVHPGELVGSTILDRIDLDQREALKGILVKANHQFSNPLRIPILINDEASVFDGIAHRVDDQIVMELENPNRDTLFETPSCRSLDHHFQLTNVSLKMVQGSKSIEQAAQIVCEELKNFTGFDRVMLYRFAPDFHGEVIGEAREEHLEPFLGLHYPATDIPKQARELYKKNWIRLIHDVNATPAGLYPSDRQLDMSDCVLRSVSPVHIQYLKNMGVTSSMSISLLNGDELWGLIACHHYSGPYFVSYAMRASCVHYGLVIATQFLTRSEKLALTEEAERHSHLIQVTSELSAHGDFQTALEEKAPELLEIVCAEGIAIAKNNEISLHGSTPDLGFIENLIQLLETNDGIECFTSNNLSRDLPDLGEPPKEATGVLTLGLGGDCQVVFFRKEETESIRWAGNPETSPKPDQLTPRHSFEEWVETVRGNSRKWTEIDKAIAHELRNSLMAFIVLQSRQLEALNQQLANKSAEVEQFAYTVSHDLKSPLVTVAGYVEALEEDLDEGDKETALDSLSRIKRATQKMNLLLEELLEFSRIGKHSGSMTSVDMNELITDLKADFDLRIQNAGANLTFADHFPKIRGHKADIYRVIHNLLENSLKYGAGTEGLTIEVGYEQVPLAIRMFVRDNGPGIDPAFHDRIFNLFQRVDEKSKGSGVGLASVQKIATQHQGSCGIESAEGKGTTIWVEFPAQPERFQFNH